MSKTLFERMTDIALIMRDEADESLDKFPLFNTAHEGYAVIKEEFDELWEEIKRYPNHDDAIWYIEAIQLGAMVIKFVVSVVANDETRED